MKQAIVKTTEIELGDRFRKEYGDIEELALSIKENGLINPIAVQSDDGNPPYQLAAGGRRFAACMHLGMEEIPCNIYDHPLSELELRSIELEENIRRKDLTFQEEVNLKRDIFRLQEEIHGRKVSTSPDASGVSQRDVAKMLGKDPGAFSRDVKLAEVMEAMPDIGWDKCKNKTEAFKILANIEEKYVRGEIAKRARETMGEPSSKALMDAYMVMDFFEHVKKLPDRTFDLVEIDPPYGIDLPQLKLHSGGGSSGGDKFLVNYGSSYNEIASSQYEEFVRVVLAELYRVMSDDSWLVMWYGPEPWAEMVFNAIINAGFKTRRLPGIWTKSGGQCNHPDIYLASCYENFYYAYKGHAVINLNKRGRSNLFDFSPVSPTKKIHPTERPIELVKEILSVFAHEGARVYVPFCGSGNTLAAADELGMYPIGCDLGQEYKDAYVTRLLLKEEGK